MVPTVSGGRRGRCRSSGCHFVVAGGLVMDLGDRGGRWRRRRSCSVGGFSRDGLRDAVGGRRRPGRSVGQSSNSSTKIAPWAFRASTIELVVDDLVPDVDRGAPFLQGHLDDLDRAVHPGAEAAGSGEVEGQGGQGRAWIGLRQGWDRFTGLGRARPVSTVDGFEGKRFQ